MLIKVLRQSKGYNARKLLEEFPDKDWFCSALDRLLRQIDTTRFADRKSGSSREHAVCTRDMQVSVQMATTLSINCNWWYCVRTAKATFPYWKLQFLSFIFKQLLLKNCKVDFVEICNVCTWKAVIKAAKRIFNSDKICRSYCDFYFWRHFLEHSVCPDSDGCDFREVPSILQQDGDVVYRLLAQRKNRPQSLVVGGWSWSMTSLTRWRHFSSRW